MRAIRREGRPVRMGIRLVVSLRSIHRADDSLE